MRIAAVIACFLFFASTARADQFVETFSSRAQFDSGTAIWNQALGALHPSLHVVNYEAGSPPPIDIDVGDGSDGDFDVATYASFSQNGDLSGNIIRLDTSVHPALNVTNFHLAAGWVLQPVGPNPLIIRSLSDIKIEGDIQCQGGDGGDAAGGTAGAGGQGRCGGANGGGGGVLFNGISGDDAVSGVVTGGGGGNWGVPPAGGGGGGSWNTSSLPTNGPNSTGLGGQAGTSVADPAFSTIAGGAGGGGGGNEGGASPGGGGGAGGGAVLITAVRDFSLGTAPSSVTGFIYVNGGNGGGSSSTGGPGGGGGGGSVNVFAGRNIDIYNTSGSGASQANGGTGGTNSNALVGAVGGGGRSWYSSVFYNVSGTGSYTPAEQAPVVHGNNVEFNSAAQNVVSKPYDTQSSAPSGISLSISPVSADFVEAGGSSDNFVSDDTGWTTTFANLDGKRYLRFRVTITTSNVTTPTMVSSVTMTYTPSILSDFQFGGACGRVDAASPWNLLPLAIVILYLLTLKFVTQKQRRRNGLNHSWALK